MKKALSVLRALPPRRDLGVGGVLFKGVNDAITNVRARYAQIQADEAEQPAKRGKISEGLRTSERDAP